MLGNSALGEAPLSSQASTSNSSSIITGSISSTSSISGVASFIYATVGNSNSITTASATESALFSTIGTSSSTTTVTGAGIGASVGTSSSSTTLSGGANYLYAGTGSANIATTVSGVEYGLYSTVGTSNSSCSATATYASGTLVSKTLTVVDDTQIKSNNKNTNYSTATDLEATSYSSTDITHSLFKFTELNSLGAGTVTNAKIRLYLTAGSAATNLTINAYRILKPFNVATATWNVFDTASAWDVIGGYSNDISSTLTASVVVNATTLGYYEFTSTQLNTDIQNIINGNAVNNGWLIERSPDSAYDAKYSQFGSSENTSGKRPQLVFDYVASGTGAVGINDQKNNVIFQRQGTIYPLSFSGTYAGIAATSIEIQLYAADGTTVLNAWSPLSSITASGGTWSGMMNVPQGGMYRFSARFKDGSNTVLATSAISNNLWGVGANLLAIGSSTTTKWFDSTSGTGLTSNANIRRYDNGVWSAGGTDGGFINVANNVNNLLNIPVGMIRAGVSGSQLVEWADRTNAVYVAFLAILAGMGGKFELVVSSVGSNDAAIASTVPSFDVHLSRYLKYIANIRLDSGQPNLPVFISGTNGRPSAYDTQFDFVRTVELNLATYPNVYFGATSLDLPLSGDNIHLSPAGFTTQLQRIALAHSNYYGISTYYRGPYITNYAVSGSTATVNVIQSGGTNLSITGFHGFTASDSSGSLSITSATVLTANTIAVLFARTPASNLLLKYASGSSPFSGGQGVHDNTALALPMDVAPTMVADVSYIIGNSNSSVTPTATLTTTTNGTSSFAGTSTSTITASAIDIANYSGVGSSTSSTTVSAIESGLYSITGTVNTNTSVSGATNSGSFGTSNSSIVATATASAGYSGVGTSSSNTNPSSILNYFSSIFGQATTIVSAMATIVAGSSANVTSLVGYVAPNFNTGSFTELSINGTDSLLINASNDTLTAIPSSNASDSILLINSTDSLYTDSSNTGLNTLVGSFNTFASNSVDSLYINAGNDLLYTTAGVTQAQYNFGVLYTTTDLTGSSTVNVDVFGFSPSTTSTISLNGNVSCQVTANSIGINYTNSIGNSSNSNNNSAVGSYNLNISGSTLSNSTANTSIVYTSIISGTSNVSATASGIINTNYNFTGASNTNTVANASILYNTNTVGNVVSTSSTSGIGKANASLFATVISTSSVSGYSTSIQSLVGTSAPSFAENATVSLLINNSDLLYTDNIYTELFVQYVDISQNNSSLLVNTNDLLYVDSINTELTVPSVVSVANIGIIRGLTDTIGSSTSNSTLESTFTYSYVGSGLINTNTSVSGFIFGILNYGGYLNVNSSGLSLANYRYNSVGTSSTNVLVSAKQSSLYKSTGLVSNTSIVSGYSNVITNISGNSTSNSVLSGKFVNTTSTSGISNSNSNASSFIRAFTNSIGNSTSINTINAIAKFDTRFSATAISNSQASGYLFNNTAFAGTVNVITNATSTIRSLGLNYVGDDAKLARLDLQNPNLIAIPSKEVRYVSLDRKDFII